MCLSGAAEGNEPRLLGRLDVDVGSYGASSPLSRYRVLALLSSWVETLYV